MVPGRQKEKRMVNGKCFDLSLTPAGGWDMKYMCLTSIKSGWIKSVIKIHSLHFGEMTK